jgi:hypothetical protein
MASNSSPLPPESDVYDLSPHKPAAKAPRSANAARFAPPSLAYRTAPTKSSAGLSTDTELLKNVQIPLVLLTVGIIIQFIAAWFEQGSLIFNVAAVVIGLVLGVAITLVGILIAAKLRAIDLGRFPHTLLKLAAICTFPSALLLALIPVLRFIPILGPLGGVIGEFVLYFALLGVFFDLEESDTWCCVLIIFLVNLGVYLLLRFVLFA